MELEAKKISLEDYVLSGGGANGESFDHKTDKSVMLKLYFPGKARQPLDEMLLARKVYALGIPTPEPGEYVVTDDGRYGILFRRITGKKSFSRATADHPENVKEYAETFAGMCLDLHAKHVDTTQFESVKARYFHLLEESPFFTPAEKDRIGRFISDAPDTDMAIHGDLQFSNAIFVGDHRYFIDLGDFKETFHMPKALAGKFWEHFAPAYFGSDRPLKDIEEEILPYAGLKTLIIERDMKEPMPVFREALKSVL